MCMLHLKTKLNAGVRCINYIGKILLFFAECATLRFIHASVRIRGGFNIMNENLDFGKYIPDLWCEVYKETLWEQGKLP